MTDTSHDAPEVEYEFDYEIVIAMLGLLADDLIAALELDEVSNRKLINEWSRAFEEAPHTLEGSEKLEVILDQMWTQVQKIEARILNKEDLAAYAYAVHGWEQAGHENNPAPFGKFE